jgi:NAD(P)-dependent dehydrogenase (short-subunit alcohol dehydrogenase family)
MGGHLSRQGIVERGTYTHLSEGGKKPTPATVNRELKNILSRREIRRTLEVIKSHGGEAVYIAADVTNPKKVKEQLLNIQREFGPITGIIHGAGNLADKNLEKKSEADFDIVYHTKVTGLQAVLESVDMDVIRYLVLFSSVSGYYGKDGQADYALSNEILNKLAHAFSKNHPNAFIRSINWGPWDGGMVSPELKEFYRKFQLDVMPINEGVNFLVNELRHARTGNSQIIICPKGLDRLVTLAQEAMVKKNTATAAAIHL